MENNLKVAKVKYSVSQMTSAFIILLAIYIFRSRILFFLKGNNGNLIRSIVAFVISLICSYFAYNYAYRFWCITNYVNRGCTGTVATTLNKLLLVAYHYYASGPTIVIVWKKFELKTKECHLRHFLV